MRAPEVRMANPKVTWGLFLSIAGIAAARVGFKYLAADFGRHAEIAGLIELCEKSKYAAYCTAAAQQAGEACKDAADGARADCIAGRMSDAGSDAPEGMLSPFALADDAGAYRFLLGA